MLSLDTQETEDFLKKSLKECPPLTPDEETTLIKIMKDEKMPAKTRMLSRNKLIEGNSRFVYAIASMKARKNGKSIADMYQAGIFGMMIAAQKYDPDLRVKGKKVGFRSYAVWWIAQKINEEVHLANNAVHVPPYGKSELWKRLRENNLDATKDRDRKFLHATAPVLSLELPIKTDGTGDMTLGETIPGVYEDMEDIMNMENDDILAKIIRESVDGYEYKLLRDAYLYGMTQAELGAPRGVSGERMRVRKNNALRKIRNNLRKFAKEKGFVYDNIVSECKIVNVFPEKYK